MIETMNASEQARSHSTGPSVHVAADDCARHACMVAPLNIQYHKKFQFTMLMRDPMGCQALMVILPNIQYPQIQATPRRRELLGCQALKKARAVLSIRVGNRLGGEAYLQEVQHGGRANRQEVITSVISRPLRVPSPVNSQTVEVGVFPHYAIQTDRVATGGERWRSMHPPPWPHQSAGKLPMSSNFAD